MRGKLLITADDFIDAMRYRKHSIVYQQDKFLDQGGIVEEHTLEIAKINDSYFLKQSCQFVVKYS